MFLPCAYPIIKETVPASNLGYHSNNRYDGFPPLMSDGRSIVATGKSEPLSHNALLKKTGIVNNAQYREYMIKNSRQIMMDEFRSASNDTGFSEEGRFADYLLAAVAPVPTAKDAKQMPYPGNQGHGNQGQKIAYKTSDLKEIYLSREQLVEKRNYPAFPA
jgi:hypothetical protein